MKEHEDGIASLVDEGSLLCRYLDPRGPHQSGQFRERFLNRFLFIKNKWLLIFLEGFSALEKKL